MLILNKTGFRGMYREGPRGLNIPYGNYKNPGIFDEAHLGVVAELLQGVEFRCTDYSTALDMAKAGDFIYLDPPYAPEMATSFVGYNAGGFMDHATLFASIRRLPCNWLMSNSSVPAVHAAFDGCRVKVVEARRAINSKNPGAKTEEVLITNQSEMRAS
jgi:DNA adenine methylase